MSPKQPNKMKTYLYEKKNTEKSLKFLKSYTKSYIKEIIISNIILLILHNTDTLILASYIKISAKLVCIRFFSLLWRLFKYKIAKGHNKYDIDKPW